MNGELLLLAWYRFTVLVQRIFNFNEI